METTILNTDTRSRVSELTAQGYSVRNIASMLGVSEGTVSYHRKNNRLGVETKPKAQVRTADASAYAHIADMTVKVRTMQNDGISVRGTAIALGVSETTVSYHRRKKEPVQLQLF